MYKRYFELAAKEAQCSDFNKFHIGCIAVYKNKIVGKGCNTYKTHPIPKMYVKYRFSKEELKTVKPLLHAEMNCIISIKCNIEDYSKLKLFICRVSKTGKMGMARPCPSCMKFIMNKGIKDIYYSTSMGYAHEELIIE